MPRSLWRATSSTASQLGVNASRLGEDLDTFSARLDWLPTTGEFGDPWDTAIGVNWYPFRQRLLRVNGELVYMKDSPIGYSFTDAHIAQQYLGLSRRSRSASST